MLLVAVSILCLSVVAIRAPQFHARSARHLSTTSKMELSQGVDTVFVPTQAAVEPLVPLARKTPARSFEPASPIPQAPFLGAASLRSPPSLF